MSLASFDDPLDDPDFRRMNCATFQASLKGRLPRNPAVHDEDAIDKCIEEMSSAIQATLAASAPKHRPRADSRPPLPTSIKDEVRLKDLLRKQW
jgi:hypothetical protein